MKKIYLPLMLIAVLVMASLLTTAQGTWVQKATFGGMKRYFAAGFSIGAKAYLGTGNNNGAYYNDFWEYDQGSNTWTQKANFGGSIRDGATGFAIGTKGYIGTGKDTSSTQLNDFWEYDPAGNIWTRKANFGGGARTLAIGFVIGTKGYIGTGGNFNGSFHSYNDFWEYDTTANQWTQKAYFGGVARTGAAGFAIGTKGYIGSGVDNVGNLYNDFWEYDQSNNTWTQKANVGGTARGNATGFAIGTKGYIGVGYNSSGYSNDFWEYNQGNNTWTQKANFGGTLRDCALGFAIGTKGYIGTGEHYDSLTHFLNDFWEYTPDSITGIEELNINNAINIYPNPLTSSSTLQLNTQVNNAEVVIYDMVGKELIRKKLTGDRLEIEKGSLERGVYFVRVLSEERGWVAKMVVE
jgi:hypothetical protein